MSKLMVVGLIGLMLLLVGCGTIASDKSADVVMATSVLVDTNSVVVAPDEANTNVISGLSLKTVGDKLNNRYGYIGLGSLVVAVALTVLLIARKRPPRRHRR